MKNGIMMKIIKMCYKRLLVALLLTVYGGIAFAQTDTINVTHQPPSIGTDGGYNLADARLFHRAMNLEIWDDGGDLSRFIYLHPSGFFPTAVIHRSGPVSELVYELNPEIGDYKLELETGISMTVDEYVANSAVDGFIILHRGRIVYEAYPHMRQQGKHLLFSVTKAVIGTAVGILEDRGEIDLTQGIDFYIPELVDSEWAGITIRDILDMASGMQGIESYGKPYQDPAHKHYQLEASLGWLPVTPELPDAVHQEETYSFLATLKSVEESGTRWLYTSSNSAILGWLLERVRDMPLAEVLSEEIWQHIGAESDALIIVNNNGIPVAHAGMVTTLRDLARFGLLFTESWEEVSTKQIISKAFFDRIQRDGRPELLPEEHNSRHPAYHWDRVTGEGALFKGGFGGQLLIVYPVENVVIAYVGTNEDLESQADRLPLQKLINDLFKER
jgi:CubicO group peptidase (beta-lactamase class C family)